MREKSLRFQANIATFFQLGYLRKKNLREVLKREGTSCDESGPRGKRTTEKASEVLLKALMAMDRYRKSYCTIRAREIG